MKHVEITTTLYGSDYELFKRVIERGIDSHLEAFTESTFEEKDYRGQPRLVMSFEVSELPLLVRRLNEDGEDGEYWALNIQDLDEYPPDGSSHT